jgi:uncharacterized protein (TIGR00730 family)
MSLSIGVVTVYCSSSRQVPNVYLNGAIELGAAIAAAGWRLVYGGNRIGCMGALADAVRAAGGKVTGITPQLLVDQGIAHDLCDELIVTGGMRERKALMEERADAFIALPGGLGTFEEVFEILVSKVLGCHSKPIILLNVADYYAPLLAMIEHGIEQRFIKPSSRDAYKIVGTVSEAIDFLKESGSKLSEKSLPVASHTSAIE